MPKTSGESANTVSGSVHSTNLILSKLESMSTDIKSIKEDIISIKQENKNIIKKVDSFENNMKQALIHMQNKITSTNEEIRKIKKENVLLHDENKQLRNQINSLKQISEFDGLRITNIPLTENEDLKFILGKLCEFISFDCNVDFVEIYRLRPRNSSVIPPIILKFMKGHDKTEFLNHLKNKRSKLTTRIFSEALTESPVYISENMTPSFANLYRAARRMKNENLVKFVWFRNNKLYIRVSEDANPVVIDDEGDLEKLFKPKDSLRGSGNVLKDETEPSELEEVGSDTSDASKSSINKRKRRSPKANSIDRFFRKQIKKP